MSDTVPGSKLIFTLQVNKDGSFSAFAEGAPLFAEARTLKDLRQRVASTARAFYGREVRTALFVGSASALTDATTIRSTASV